MGQTDALKQRAVALVTGGSGGIGSAIARRLASAGMRLVVTYNGNREKAEQTVASLAGEEHRSIQLSFEDPGSVRRVLESVESVEGRLDVLVNNAGFTKAVDHKDLAGLTDELIDRIFQVNWRGAFAMVRAGSALLEAGEGGVIVNISSVAGRTGLGSNVAYCASKAALDSMTRSLARALAPKIRVLSVSPGWVAGEYASRMPRELLDSQRKATPLGRIAAPEDVAEAVAAAVFHLPFSTGDIIPVDGGRPLGI
ncbi:MAG: SDR family NAD(P)-dependent oxidoreductase [Alkalispirochaetaceae bacterium]